MNKKAFLCAAIGLLAALPGRASTNYICQVNGKAVYTTQKVSQTCQVSEMNGISEESVSVTRTGTPGEPPAAGAPRTLVLTSAAELYGDPSFSFNQGGETDQIAKIWEKEQFGAYDDIKIAPRTDAAEVFPHSSKAGNDLNVKLRNQPAKTPSRSVKANTRTPSAVHTAPIIPPKPKLTRKQILQREIAGEQAALVRAQAQLAKARQSGKGNVAELQQAVRDRTANVRAIQSELKRH